MAQRDVAAHLADLEPVSRGGTVHGTCGVAAMMERDFPCCEAPGGHDVQPAPPAFPKVPEFSPPKLSDSYDGGHATLVRWSQELRAFAQELLDYYAAK